MAKVGDIVRYLNAVGGGRIVRIDGSVAYVDEDGFETPVLIRECVVVTPAAPSATPKAPAVTEMGKAPTAQQTQKAAPAAKVEEPPIVIKETPEREKLNIVLGYEAADLKRLSNTEYATYVVNDSNYYLLFNYMTRANDDRQWTLRYSGTIEPGIEQYIGSLNREDLSEIDRVAVQILAFKQDKPFDLKAPINIEQRLDATKFFKLHCFQPNPYFDVPVIALNLVTEDLPLRPLNIDTREMQQAMQTKANADRQPARRPEHKKTAPDEPLVVDLHIEQLVDNTRGLSNADMLNLQIDTFRKVMDANLRHHGKKIVFIHGKGEGVLRHAILKELNYRYKGNDVQDASFREYGFGATQVKIK